MCVRSRSPHSTRALLVVTTLALASAPSALAAQSISSAAGASAADITATVAAFRTSLGALNPNVAGSFGGGRREINWDGVPDASAAPSNLAANFFNVNSPRGVVLSTPGTGFMVSANAGSPGGASVEFGNIDPSYTSTFAAFSAQRLFTALGSNVTDVNFFVAGSSTAALSNGFGIVFTDVDLANTTSIEYFDALNNSLGKFYAPPVAGSSESFSFLGVLFSSAVVGRVRITAGNAALAAGFGDQNGNGRDLVVMDDFIYGEPVTSVVPEPATDVLVLAGLAGLAIATRRRRLER